MDTSTSRAIIYKTCNNCKLEKSTALFNKDKGGRFGVRGICKDCQKVVNRERYLANREKRLAKQKEYYQQNREKAIEYARQWSKDNPEKCKEYHEVYAEKYPEKERLRHFNKAKKYREEKPELVKEWDRRWRENHPEKVALKNQKRRAKYSEFLVTEKDIRKIYSSQCVACGTYERITLDHIVPLSRGGNHSLGNLQPLCFSCNSSKGNKLMSEWNVVRSNHLT